MRGIGLFKIASYCAVISSSWVNGSLAVAHDQRDPSKNGDPCPTDPFPSLIALLSDCSINNNGTEKIWKMES